MIAYTNHFNKYNSLRRSGCFQGNFIFFITIAFWLLWKHPVFNSKLLFPLTFSCHQDSTVVSQIQQLWALLQLLFVTKLVLLFPQLTQSVKLPETTFHLSFTERYTVPVVQCFPTPSPERWITSWGMVWQVTVLGLMVLFDCSTS